MKIVEIKKTAIEISTEDWSKLGSLRHDFDKICDSSTCSICPLAKFCENHDCPGSYLADLYEFLDD